VLNFLNEVILLPWSVGKYLFSFAVYWYTVNYTMNTNAFLAFTEYVEQRWNDWVKKK